MNSVVSSPKAPFRTTSSLKQPVRRALGGGAVVADDVVDERVVEDLEVGERVDQPADVVVGVLEEARRRPPSGARAPASGRRACRPTPGSRRARSVSSASGGITPSSFCRANVRSRSASQPSSNLPLYLSDHSGAHVVRGVRRARRVVDEERLVGHQRLLLADPVDGVVGHVLGEVVALLGRPVGLDRHGVLVDRRRVLVRLAADEAVEVLEAASRSARR